MKEERVNREEPLKIQISDEIDLHTFRAKDIPVLIEEYLIECKKMGYKRVRIIHGKGKSYKKFLVIETLKNLDFVNKFYDAPIDQGGWGCTIVELVTDDY